MADDALEHADLAAAGHVTLEPRAGRLSARAVVRPDERRILALQLVRRGVEQDERDLRVDHALERRDERLGVRSVDRHGVDVLGDRVVEQADHFVGCRPLAAGADRHLGVGMLGGLLLDASLLRDVERVVE